MGVLARELVELAEERGERVRVEQGDPALAGARAEELREGGLQPRPHGDGADAPGGVHVEARHHVGEGAADVLRERLGVLHLVARVAERLEDGDEVADRDALLEEPLEHAVQRAERDLPGHHLVDERGVGLLERVDHLLHVLPAEHLARVGLEHLHEVRGDDGGGVDDDVAEGLGLHAAAGGDPAGGHAEARVHRLDPLHGAEDAAGVEGEEEAGHDLGAGDLGAAELDDVLVGREPDVVADADGRDEDAELERGLLAEHGDALEEVAALRLVDEGDEGVADLELDGVDLEEVAHGAVLALGRLGLHRLLGHLRLLGPPLLAGGRHAGERAGDGAEGEEGEGGEAGYEGEGAEHPRGDPHGARVRAELRGEGGAHPHPRARRGGDHEARRGADDERRHLRDEPVAHREDGVVGERLLDGEAALHHPDEDSADDVDDGDEEPGDGVALHELGGAVHRAVEVGELGDLLAAAPRLALVEEPGVEVGVDRHLLAGHGVQGEARRDLGHAPRALGDDDEVDRHQDDEEHHPHGVVAADDEVPERLDHPARLPLAQDEPGAGDVERQPEEGEEEEHRREDAELQRVGRVERDQQDDERETDAEGQEEVQHEAGERHHQEGDDSHDPQRDPDLGAALGVGGGGHARGAHAVIPPRSRPRFPITQARTSATAR